ncbi:hypothetical protein COT77_00105 [Candidatus Berkelbacteria bacterium CG10_big_fil_rev_8_21_14_0_10_41_12]|uniref:Methyltransferase type 11 domain-containing protein n=1 Tax=Candidatus Berkelbacteria bacterium CG10_big_fil_rev_8_21_14_0_10_41_12 TaxID=1974513 RepID=A0A2M6WY07_9BACT|nr:MAG: hypothetical protein COT77_00105 [Candidatus Berkelbacteria bacterium CG10_big_fil_rev_8_21_14_0_10_41_12]
MLIDFFRKTYHRNVLEQLIKENASLISGSILDIGSKNRRYDYLFDGHVTAVDIIPNKNKKVIAGDIEKGLAFDNNYFDAIICLEVFEYLDHYRVAIEEIHRVLRPGGKAIISVPFMYPDHQDKKRFTEEHFTKKIKKLFIVKAFRIGNGYILIWDIIRKKIKLIKYGSLRYLAFLIFLPYLLILRLFKIERIRDNFYSGLFFILEKKKNK